MRINRGLFLLGVVCLLQSLPVHSEGVAVDETRLSQWAVQDRGRKKPMTTFTQESLLALTGKSVYRPGEGTAPLSASTVMLGLWLEPARWEDKPLILVSYQPLAVGVMGLPARQKLFSYREVTDNDGLKEWLADFQRQRMRNPGLELTPLQKQAQQLVDRVRLYEMWSRGLVAVVPHPQSSTGVWLPIHALGQYYSDAGGQAAQSAFLKLREAWTRGDSAAFNEALERVSKQFSALSPAVYPSERTLSFERSYQLFHPFRWAWIAYALAAVVLALTSGWQQRTGYILGWLFVLTGFAFQVYGFYCRVAIAGRAPVTNMYETVIWLAFGTVLFAVILEAVYRCRYFLLAATPVAVLSLVLADTLPTVLDSSIQPLVPVLRNNFWLVIHVLTITLSYAAFALALGVAHIALGKIIAQPQRNDLAPIYNYLYRTLQVGVLLLATGTILGGVWANYSWGRFWDWDPKETWALTALLCYLLVLHGRIAGWWGGFGLAVGAVLCFLSVLMAWYGVNFVLGKGLHSYGFGTGGYSYALGFVGAEIIFLAMAVRMRSLPVRTQDGKSLSGTQEVMKRTETRPDHS
jgi:cytochrome c-type biogenesis protein CcsB